MDALSGVGGQWTYGSLPTLSGSRSQPNGASGPSAVQSSSGPTAAAARSGATDLADVVAANAGASSSTQYMSSSGYSDVMAALARQAIFSRQALGGNVDLKM